MPDISYRPLTIADKQAYFEIITQEYIEVFGSIAMTAADETRPYSGYNNFELSQDTQVAVTELGNIVGYTEVWATSDEPVRPQIYLYIAPDYRNQGIEDTLLQLAIERAKAVYTRLPADAQVITFVNNAIPNLNPVLERFDFVAKQQTFRMRIDFDDQPPQAEFPEGFHIVTMAEHPHLKDFIRTYRTAFRDKRDYVEDALENRVARWQNDIEVHHEFYDPSYFIMLKDKDVEVGALLAWTTSRESSDEAWISIVGIMPDYRRRGLARNLLYHAFNRIHDSGRKAAALSVDGANTGAVKLYQEIGMRPVVIFNSYERELRAENTVSQ